MGLPSDSNVLYAGCMGAACTNLLGIKSVALTWGSAAAERRANARSAELMTDYVRRCLLIANAEDSSFVRISYEVIDT